MSTRPESKSKRGGRRQNAGRPTPDGVSGPKPRKVTLDDKTVDKATRLGDGNLSAGIRIAVNKIVPD